MPPFNLIWSQNGSVIHGYTSGVYNEGSLVFPISFPSITSDPQKITLISSALANGTFDILSNVRFYLTGTEADLNIVQGYTPTDLPIPEGGWPIGWPNLGLVGGNNNTELNGGLQISFDGINWTTFSSVQAGAVGSVSVGDLSDYDSWVVLPAISVGLNGSDGIIGPFDTATMYLRYIIPPGADNYQLFNIALACDVDIV
jgi:hypothetical protein